MDTLQSDLYGHNQQINALVVDRSTTNSGHIVNNAHIVLDQQAQKLRDSAVVEAQLHLSTILGADVSKSSFERQATFPKARHVIGSIVKSSQITTCFENGTQSRQYLQSLNTYDAERESNDGTIPTHPEQKRALVGVLVQAFRSTAVAKDKSKYIEAFADKNYDNRLVEARCWQILEFSIERSKRQALLRLWGGDKTKSEGTHARDMKFADRFDGIVKVLSTWKKSCDRVYQAPFIPQLVDNPDWAAKQIINNTVGNDRKAMLLDMAKQAEEDGAEQHSGPATTPSPTKRRKTMSTPSSSRRESVRTPRSGQITDRAPPPQFPSISQLSASRSYPALDNFTPSLDDLHNSTTCSLTRNRTHGLPASTDLLSSPSARPYFPIEAVAPNHHLNTANIRQCRDTDSLDVSNSLSKGLTSRDLPTSTQNIRHTSTADFETLLNLGSWQTPFATTAAPPTDATLMRSNAEAHKRDTGHRHLENTQHRRDPNPSRQISRPAALTRLNEEQAFHDPYSTGVETGYHTRESDTLDYIAATSPWQERTSHVSSPTDPQNVHGQYGHDVSPRHILPGAPCHEQQKSAPLQGSMGTGMGGGLGPEQPSFSMQDLDMDLLQGGWTWRDGATVPDEYWL